MEAILKGKRSKYSGKQKEATQAALSSTPVNNHNLPVEVILEMEGHPGAALLPEAGFEPIYTNVKNAGESYHMLNSVGSTHLFFLCQPNDPKILPDCETEVEAKWIGQDLMEIRFVFVEANGNRYLAIPFIFYLNSAELGGMTHRWELRNLLWYLACEIKLIRSQDDGLLHYVGSAPVRFYEYKKEIIYDLLASYLGVDANVEDFQPYLYKARALRRKNATFFTVKEMLALLELTAESSIGEEGRNQMVKDAVTEPYYDCIATWLDTPEWRRDEKVLQTILSLLEKPRCKDQIALSRHKVYGRLLRFLVKANELSLSTKRMLYSRLALSEALWRRRNPSPNSLDLDQFLRDEMDKLKRAFDVSE